MRALIACNAGRLDGWMLTIWDTDIPLWRIVEAIELCGEFFSNRVDLADLVL